MYSRTFNRVIRDLMELKSRKRTASSKKLNWTKKEQLGKPDHDFDYLTNSANRVEIEDNIKKRKNIGNIKLVTELNDKCKIEQNVGKKENLMETLLLEANKIPNKSHPDVKQYEYPKVVKSASLVKHPFRAGEFCDLAKDLRLAKFNGLTNFTGKKSYFFFGDLADLENALIKYSLSKLISKKFKLVSVPDILPAEVIKRCGMTVKEERSQVYFLEEGHGKDLCLSGTSEMALAELVSNTTFNSEELPVLMTSVSRCYRAELSSCADEKGIYRVHEFSKVEMFGVSHPDHSESLLEQFIEIEEEMFKSLGIDYQVLDMPLYELGAPAYRKFDIEAWLPGREAFGEISSCSNCTCYQARRLNIKFKDDDRTGYAHTINGTCCAIPRMMIALLETHQLQNGNIRIPEPLRKYFNGKEEIQRQQIVPRLKPQSKDLKSKNS